MNAAQLASAVLEGEDPKDFLKRVVNKYANKKFAVGQEVIHGTGDTRDIMDACLTALKSLDYKRFISELSDHDVFQYTTLGEIHNDFDPEYYLYERLFNIMQKYCPTFTYFGGREADGAIGCWPPDGMAVDELVGMDKLTYVEAGEAPRAADIMSGDFSSVPTDYVLLELVSGEQALYSKTTMQQIWRY